MGATDVLICFSHQRWAPPFQRTHDLLKEAARERQVYFVEEPVFAGARPSFELLCAGYQLLVMRPFLPPGTDNLLVPLRIRELLVDQLFRFARLERYLFWFCTPMAMAFARDLTPTAVIYDRSSDLPELDDGAAGLAAYHTQLLAAADVVIEDGSAITWDEIAAALAPRLEAA